MMSSLRKTLKEARELQRKALRELHPWRNAEINPTPSARVTEAAKPNCRPFIDRHGDLVIPFESNPRYHWWRGGGQSILDTLLELGAQEDILDRYVMNWRLKITEEQLN